VSASANHKQAAQVTPDAAEYSKDFWDEENLRYSEPHFRAEKVARLANKTARGKECDLLDVGCGPGALRYLLHDNIHYYGIDIAIHEPAPNLIEADLLETPIEFNGKQFDIIVAQGIFEYFGTLQAQKFAEIRAVLAKDGRFLLSYWNFGHRDARIHLPFSNMQPIDEFRSSLASSFSIISSFPASHNWRQNMSDRKFLKLINMRTNINIPLVSPRLAVEYFFICSHQGPDMAAGRH
jgi:cyclopropane fatty-acyl-phospholipid synthase-like methyltransferase